MAGSAGGGDDDIIVSINVTPLVDVVLVLLVIFMVTARFMTPPAIPLELPKASTGEEGKSSSISISIRKAEAGQKEQFYLNGKLLQVPELRKQIAEKAKKEGSKLQAVIAADHAVPHGKVIWILDVLRRHGVEQYAFNIDVAEKDAAP